MGETKYKLRRAVDFIDISSIMAHYCYCRIAYFGPTNIRGFGGLQLYHLRLIFRVSSPAWAVSEWQLFTCVDHNANYPQKFPQALFQQ
jgi:hypothetical protein